MEILTLNQRFENSRIYNTYSSVLPFSVLTVGAIYKIIQFDSNLPDYYKEGANGIITIVKEGDEDCTMFRVWTPISLLRDLDRSYPIDIVRIRPTGLHTNINTNKQYYTYELSISDL